MSFWATELLGLSPRVSYTLQNFLGFHRSIRCLTRFSGFSPEGGYLSPTCYARHISFFHFHLTLWNSIKLRPIPKPTQFNNKRSAKSVPCTHSHVMWCYRTPMQCNLCHCTQTHDQCIKTSTWTFYTVHYVCAMNTHV